MTTQLDRRTFLRSAAKYSSGAILAPSLAGLIACNDRSPTGAARSPTANAAKGLGGYGTLVPHATLPFLIPAGFQLTELSRAGNALQGPGRSGVVPNALDGMAAMRMRSGNIRLVRNHEIRDGAGLAPALGARPYDAMAGAGCTSLEVEVDQQGVPHVIDEFVSIGGTFVNCAGGPTPWGSWLTCEETTAGTTQGFAEEHGYVFEVDGAAQSVVDAIPIKSMGRFSHEAIAVDTRFGHVYLTEDAGSSGFFRFVPNSRRDLLLGGRLQMLAVEGLPQLDTRNGGIAPLAPLPAVWVDVDEPDPAVITSATSCFAQGFAKGGTNFARLEGCWYGDQSCFFNATSGGAAGAGQVWQYRPHNPREGELMLIFESPGASVLDSPDNICVSPRGGLVLCEDGDDTQFMRGLTQQGVIFDFVQSADVNATEFAGATFSPDGDILFFNVQGSTSAAGTVRGATFATWGPWRDGAL
jgi:secreted PhoX family phosphatase